ncbi:hypothetical protein BZL30_0466 [Mycobacterium kansasii]|uniref:Uncharacterized protein n=1 Tax=Mycobacterium kansasii TaxID=1768 RepID=A0A1V3XRL4_MYCKA|nr:hypothetical protein BZL30_0466 [Mycobacterium kansasii]
MLREVAARRWRDRRDVERCSGRADRRERGHRSIDHTAGSGACSRGSADHRGGPPAADPVSVQSAVEAGVRGSAHAAVAARASRISAAQVSR